jgi:Zn-dependent metalloprotease
VRAEGQLRVKDRNINNCYEGLGITARFYKAAFDRNSLDGKGMALIGSCHFLESDEPMGYNNAFWNGKQMVFGDGDGIVFDYLTDSLDVIAHELTHGFVQYSSELRYWTQSGALNESVADVFACMVEQWHTNQTADQADWILGQTLFPVAYKGIALRSLRSGKAFVDDPVMGTDPQPKHMKDLYTGPKDSGGVHINSGIPNHAFYLAATTIGGFSWEKVGKVWYKTMVSGRVPNTCDFKTFANITVDIAEKVFPGDGSVKSAIGDAWVHVGVL